MNLIQFRGLERLIAVLIGAFCVYLGYKLFDKLPEKSDGSGKAVLPGGISIYLSRVGPGVFFALFGAVIIIYSIITQVTINDPMFATYASDQDSTGIHQITYFGNQEGIIDSTEIEKYRYDTRDYILKLNHLTTFLNKGISDKSAKFDEQLVTDINIMMPEIKHILMARVWAEDWGDYKSFKRWVKNKNYSDYPDAIKTAAEIFNKK
ncbi:MAG: hypothetical protein GWN00_25805 [Aliifodinibius sp.]|nr:hypothetical protein [Fodinibius sp.]NIV14255.1 hypothetical protein [Fodinibius sp.]NIY28090.1 hypothetical protein [Fodinibius sp.]